MTKNENTSHFDTALAAIDLKIAQVARRRAPLTAGRTNDKAAQIARLEARRAGIVARKGGE